MPSILNIQILDALGVRLDKGFPRRHLVPHQDVEDVVGFSSVLHLYLEQGAGGRVHGGVPELLGGHLAQALIALDLNLLVLKLGQGRLLLRVGIDPLVELARLNPVERRLGDKQMPVIDELGHVAEEEGEQQGADVGAVDVGVRHQDNAVVAQLGGVELVVDARPQRGDDSPDFFVGEHLVGWRLLHVEDFTPQRQDGLEAAVAPLFSRAPR